MVQVRPPTSRIRVADQNGYMTTEFLNLLYDLVNRAGGVGDVTLLASLSVGSSTDNAVTRFDGSGGTQLQSSSVTIDDSGNVSVPVSATFDGRDVSVDGTKLDGIEAGATADQTASEIKTLYESNADTNAFTDSDETKLSGIETGATADQTASEIKTLYESNADTNAFTDSEKTKLGGIETGAEVNDVDTVFGRTGSVTAQASDYDASQVDNDSGVTGADVAAALDTLNADKPDFSSGTWTPVLIGTSTTGTNSYTAQRGSYQRVGDWVTAEFEVRLDGTAGALDSTGNLQIDGLPILNAEVVGGGLGFIDGVTFSGASQMAYNINSSGILTLWYDTTSGSSALTDTEAGDDLWIYGTVGYPV